MVCGFSKSCIYVVVKVAWQVQYGKDSTRKCANITRNEAECYIIQIQSTHLSNGFSNTQLLVLE